MKQNKSIIVIPEEWHKVKLEKDDVGNLIIRIPRSLRGKIKPFVEFRIAYSKKSIGHSCVTYRIIESESQIVVVISSYEWRRCFTLDEDAYINFTNRCELFESFNR